MDLNKLLEKTRDQAEKVTYKRPPPTIATEERPYSVMEGSTNSFEEMMHLLPQNRQQTGNKPTTNRQQSGNKPTTKWQQTDNKPETNRQQNDSVYSLQETIRQQTGNKPSTKAATEVATNRQQTGNKPATRTSFSSLVGLQRELVIFLYQEGKAKRERIVGPLTLEHLSTAMGYSKNTIKVTLQRVEKKGCVLRKEFKTGRGGWSKYEIEEATYQEILHTEINDKVATNRQQTGNKPSTKAATEPATSASSSSSVLNNINNNNYYSTSQEKAEWEQLDLRELHKQGIHLPPHQLAGVWDKIKQHTFFEIQESLDAFAYDIQHKYIQPQRPPINFLMGILHKGQIYLSSRYESPDRKLIRELAERHEKRKAMERLAEEEREEEKFMAWLNSEGQRERIEKWLLDNQLGLVADFKCNGAESREWVKKHLYLPAMRAPEHDTKLGGEGK